MLIRGRCTAGGEVFISQLSVILLHWSVFFPRGDADVVRPVIVRPCGYADDKDENFADARL